MKKSLIITLLVLGFICMGYQLSLAAPLDVWSGWTQFAADDGVDDGGFVDPGYGGQDFDAEYLYYKYECSSTTLSLGLQTGFDLDDGMVTHEGRDYYAGDLALSFGGFDGFNFGIDFGFSPQEGYYDGATGIYEAGLYSVTEWNNDVYSGYSASSPFAIKTGTKLDGGLLTNTSGLGTGSDNLKSYYRKVSFDLSKIQSALPTTTVTRTTFPFRAHWTMSCGNDVIEGEAAAHCPEPATFVMMFLGLLGLVGWRRMKK